MLDAAPGSCVARFRYSRIPLGTPDLAVEILSPDDRAADVEDKISTYLRAGCAVIVVVDPQSETLEAIVPSGRTAFRRGETFRDPAVDGLAIDVAKLFEDARR